MFVVKGETSRSHEINEKRFHEELCSSDRSGQLDERNSSSAHMVKEQHAPEVHREIVRYSTRTMSSIVKSTRRTSTSTFQDYHILQ